MKRYCYERSPDGQEDTRRVHLYSPALLNDWTSLIEDISASFEGGNGEIVLCGSYPVADCRIGPRTKLIGRYANQGSGDGFHPAKDCANLLDWDVRGNGYTNYGAGMRRIHLNCWLEDGPRASNGAFLTGSQSGSECREVFVRGHEGYALKLGGDFYELKRCHADARPLHMTQAQFKGKGQQAFAADSRLKGITGDLLTSHNNEAGIDWMDPNHCVLETIDTELTPCPIRIRYNVQNCEFRNLVAQHSECIADFSGIRMKNGKPMKSLSAYLAGRVDEYDQSTIGTPEGSTEPYGTPFAVRVSASSVS